MNRSRLLGHAGRVAVALAHFNRDTCRHRDQPARRVMVSHHAHSSGYPSAWPPASRPLGVLQLVRLRDHGVEGTLHRGNRPLGGACREPQQRPHLLLSNWVGIDGFNSNLIQTGTESDYTNGSAQYDILVEILPAAETVVFGL